jgi:hypothetical protein
MSEAENLEKLRGHRRRREQEPGAAVFPFRFRFYKYERAIFAGTPKAWEGGTDNRLQTDHAGNPAPCRAPEPGMRWWPSLEAPVRRL